MFDPGMNALALLLSILPGRLTLADAELAFPCNCATPIAATLPLTCEDVIPVQIELDFLHTDKQNWDIEIDTDEGHLHMLMGGAELRIDGDVVCVGRDLVHEYERLYQRFGQLIRTQAIDVDLAPLRIVTQALATARRKAAPDFLE